MNKVKLGDIADVFDGPHATPKKTTNGPIYLGIDAINPDGSLNPSQFSHLSDGDYIRWTRRVVPQESDIVFSYEATLGRYALIPKTFHGCLGRRLGIVRVKDAQVNPRWLHYWFMSPQWGTFMTNHVYRGSTVLRYSIEDFPSYEILLPDRKQQDAIAALLGAIDDKIALNKQMMSELEKTARLIYDYWFTQFDFPDENGNPYRSSGGKMTYNKTLNREIPTSWKVGNLYDIANRVQNSLAPKQGVLYEHYSIPAYDNNQFPTFEDGSTIDSNKLRAEPHSLLYSKLNPKYKRLWQPYCLTDNAICSTEFIIIKPKKQQLESFCHATIDSVAFYTHMANKAISSTGSRSRVDPDEAFCFNIAIPQEPLIKKFSTRADKLYARTRQLRMENHELTIIRNWLLPMLMNGQISIGHNE